MARLSYNFENDLLGIVSPERRSGNTTRLVDWYIQKIFEGKNIETIDHHNEYGNNRSLYNRIIKRLLSEHLESKPFDESFTCDKVKLTIKYNNL